MLRLDSIRFAYGEDDVLRDFGFDAEAGEVTCLTGPSGCGKSTALRLVAGLLAPGGGSIELDGEQIASPGQGLAPERRSVGLVFQEGALFPHLDVAGNVAFGLKGETSAIDRWLDMMQISELRNRMPHELSGGQRQRVALARALAPSPRVLLFDEPYANLDQGLRRRLREQVRDLVKTLGTIAVFVTHDADDVIELADKVVAVDDGRVVQFGTPRDLFDSPAHLSVAKMFGQAQTLAATRRGDVLDTRLGDWPLSCLTRSVDDGERVTLVLRPDALQVRLAEQGSVVRELRMLGPDDVALVEVEGGQVSAIVHRPHEVSEGSTVELRPLEGRVFPERHGE